MSRQLGNSGLLTRSLARANSEFAAERLLAEKEKLEALALHIAPEDPAPRLYIPSGVRPSWPM